eukprot:3286137-Lingulodinium_polyedra.AAC.1
MVDAWSERFAKMCGIAAIDSVLKHISEQLSLKATQKCGWKRVPLLQRRTFLQNARFMRRPPWWSTHEAS